MLRKRHSYRDRACMLTEQFPDVAHASFDEPAQVTDLRSHGILLAASSPRDEIGDFLFALGDLRTDCIRIRKCRSRDDADSALHQALSFLSAGI